MVRFQFFIKGTYKSMIIWDIGKKSAKFQIWLQEASKTIFHLRQNFKFYQVFAKFAEFFFRVTLFRLITRKFSEIRSNIGQISNLVTRALKNLFHWEHQIWNFNRFSRNFKTFPGIGRNKTLEEKVAWTFFCPMLKMFFNISNECSVRWFSIKNKWSKKLSYTNLFRWYRNQILCHAKYGNWWRWRCS